MNAFLLVMGGLVLLFGFVVAFGAPYLPTRRKYTDEALDMLGLKPGQTMLELGCGDGRVARRAAQRGINVIGYELNPALVLIAKAVTWRYRGQVKIVWGNLWHSNWPPADGIFVFIFDRFLKKLDKKITQKYKGKPIKLVSYGFQIPGKKPYKQKDAIFLYKY